MEEPNTATKKTVLIIEDEHFISELYQRALKKAGYVVTIMLSGEDGLAAAQTDHYDILLLDLMIPGMTGIEVLQKLKAPEAKPIHTKIIITTNLDQGDETRAEVENMADGYIIKAEITPKQLVEIIDQIEI